MDLASRHFVRDYRRLMRTMLRRHGSTESAILRATGGGDRDTFARLQLEILRGAGLRDDHYLIDVGCGAGRLPRQLTALPQLRFTGLDVVPEMIDFAREQCARADWRFLVVEGLEVPEDDDVADFVSFFSVLTHLSAAESLAYLRDAARTLKPGGKIIASYLDRHDARHRRHARGPLRQLAHRLLGVGVRNTLLDDATMADFARRLGMPIEFLGQPLGQSVCAFTKP